MSGWGFDRAQAQYDVATPAYLEAATCDYEDADGPCQREAEYDYNYTGGSRLCEEHFGMMIDGEDDDD